MCTSSSLSFGVALPAVNSVIFRHLDHARLGVDHITIFQQFEMLSMAGVGWEKVEIAETYTHTHILSVYIYIMCIMYWLLYIMILSCLLAQAYSVHNICQNMDAASLCQQEIMICHQEFDSQKNRGSLLSENCGLTFLLFFMEILEMVEMAGMDLEKRWKIGDIR